MKIIREGFKHIEGDDEVPEGGTGVSRNFRGWSLKCSGGAGVMTAIKMTLNKFRASQKGFLPIRI